MTETRNEVVREGSLRETPEKGVEKGQSSGSSKKLTLSELLGEIWTQDLICSDLCVHSLVYYLDRDVLHNICIDRNLNLPLVGSFCNNEY